MFENVEGLEEGAEKQSEEAEELAKEAEEIRREAEALEEQVNRLWAAHADLGGADVRAAIEATQEAQRENERQMQEAREKREELLARSEEALRQAEKAEASRQFAADWGRSLADSLMGKNSLMGRRAEAAFRGVEENIRRVRKTKEVLQETERKLRSLRELG